MNVGADAHIGPFESCKFAESFCIIGTSVSYTHLVLHGAFLAPSSVTVLNAEERQPGVAYFRCQTMGDTSHLLMGSEPVSYYASYAEPFQG